MEWFEEGKSEYHFSFLFYLNERKNRKKKITDIFIYSCTFPSRHFIFVKLEMKEKKRNEKREKTNTFIIHFSGMNKNNSSNWFSFLYSLPYILINSFISIL